MLQRPVPLVRCKTIPLDVPADAEIVIECEIPPGERRAEAPFGEYPGTYGPRRMNPVLKIKAITHRKNPIYQNAFVGHADNLLLSGLIRTSFIEETVKIACPTVRGVNVPRAGRSKMRAAHFASFILLVVRAVVLAIRAHLISDHKLNLRAWA